MIQEEIVNGAGCHHGRFANLAVAIGLMGSYCFLVEPARAQDVDLEKIFWCSQGEPTGSQSPEECVAARELVLQNCTACHSFVPIVKARKDDGAWNATLQPHRSRLPHLNDEQYQQISEFLKAHYNPDNPPPVLPPELEALGDIPQ